MNKEKRTEIGGGYRLVRDPYCCWVEEKRTVLEGKHKGETYYVRVSGYTTTIERAVLGLSERLTRDFDAESIKVLTDEIKSLKSSVRAWAEEIKKADGNA